MGQAVKTFALVAAALMLVGCAQPGPKPLYQWAGYQTAVYQHLKADGADPGAQIATLEAQIEKNTVAGEASPPGMHAHVALLYSKMGDDVAAQRHLQAERALFPESAAYVDFLLKASKKDSAKPAAVAPAAATAGQSKT
jgi:hypothetical protein